MKIIVVEEYDITNCDDCPYKKNHYGHGECWSYCGHQKAPNVYDSILYGCQEHFTKVPDWCPLGVKAQDD